MGEKPRVVVLEDDDVFCAMLLAVLEDDYESVVGKDGLEGLRLCRAGRVDLLITDIGMPELDGIEMLKEFQKDPALATIPTLVITATHFTRRYRSELDGIPQVRGVLLKPCHVDEITAAITGILSQRRSPSAP